MMNREGIKAFDGVLDMYFADRPDTIVSGDGYLCEKWDHVYERFAPERAKARIIRLRERIHRIEEK